MPRPTKNESESDFVSRYMGDKESRKKYPDQKQRSAIAYSLYQQHLEKGTSSMEPCLDLNGEIALKKVSKGGPGSGRHSQGAPGNYLSSQHDTEGTRIKVGDTVRHGQTGNTGTVTHTAAGPKGNKIAVEWDNPVQRMLGAEPVSAHHLTIQ